MVTYIQTSAGPSSWCQMHTNIVNFDGWPLSFVGCIVHIVSGKSIAYHASYWPVYTSIFFQLSLNCHKESCDKPQPDSLVVVEAFVVESIPHPSPSADIYNV